MVKPIPQEVASRKKVQLDATSESVVEVSADEARRSRVASPKERIPLKRRGLTTQPKKPLLTVPFPAVPERKIRLGRPQYNPKKEIVAAATPELRKIKNRGRVLKNIKKESMAPRVVPTKKQLLELFPGVTANE